MDINQSKNAMDEVVQCGRRVDAFTVALDLAIAVRCYLRGLDQEDQMARLGVLAKMEEHLPRLAEAVISPFVELRDVD